MKFWLAHVFARPMCCVFAVVMMSTSSWWRCFVRSYRRWLVRLRPSWRQRILPMSCKQFQFSCWCFVFVDSDLLLLWEWFFISSFPLMLRRIRVKASESHILNANVFRRSAKTDAGLELFYNNLQLFHTACDQTQEFVVPIWTPLLFFPCGISVSLLMSTLSVLQLRDRMPCFQKCSIKSPFVSQFLFIFNLQLCVSGNRLFVSFCPCGCLWNCSTQHLLSPSIFLRWQV